VSRAAIPGADALAVNRSIRSSDGTTVAVYDGDLDSGARLFLSHATGFCAGAWAAVIGESALGWTAWDFRGHGRSGRVASTLSWWEMGGDAAAVRDATRADAAVGVGHSMGGAALLMAEIDRRGRFDALVLYEPIIPPPPFRRDTELLLARLARKRRAVFESRQEALDNYAGKPPFDRWDARALHGYVQGGLVDETGETVLACGPATEAEVFIASGAHALVDRLVEVEIPVTVVCGAETDTYPLEWAHHLASSLPRGDLLVLPDTGHFGPMERPVELAQIIASVASSLPEE
jgi:pimeloyl-ACP methyl ester carboxylesterase